jgi:glucuronoarabinoxylan endo-1,4-beta-xylanase
MKLKKVFSIFTAIVCCFVSVKFTTNFNANAASSCVVDTSEEYQTIQGFGGINLPEWIGDLTTEQRETAFGNDENELGFTVLRVYVNNDKNQWYKALETAKYAQSQGAIVFATPWNPPDELCETFTKDGKTAKRLRHDKYAEYAQHLNDFVHYMEDNGVELYAISVQNEPDYGEDWTWWTSDECVDFISNYGDEIDCRLISPETFQYNKEYYNKILENSDAFNNIDIFGTHFYGTTRSNMDFPALEECGKPIWMTEVYVPNSSSDADTYPEALDVAENIHNGLVVGNISAYVWWYIRRSYGPMKENGDISKRGYCMAQYSKFIRPGDVRVAATEQPEQNVYVSAYKNDENTLTIVAINKGSTGYAQKFEVSGETIVDVNRYRTSANENLAYTANLEASENSFWAQLPAESVSTFIVNLDDKNSSTQPTETTTESSTETSTVATTEPTTEAVYTGNIISNLTVKDTENGKSWAIVQSLDIGSKIYGDRDFTIVEIPEELKNAEYVITACDSKKLTSDLANLTVSQDAAVYVFLDQRVNITPDWLSDWTKESGTVKASNDVLAYVRELI